MVEGEQNAERLSKATDLYSTLRKRHQGVVMTPPPEIRDKVAVEDADEPKGKPGEPYVKVPVDGKTAAPKATAPDENLDSTITSRKRTINKSTEIWDAVADEHIWIIEVADECMVEQFDAEQTKAFQDWVSGGGIAWINNSALRLFGVGYSPREGFRGCECVPAGGNHTILSGCKRVTLARKDCAAHTLEYPGVIPLLSVAEENYNDIAVGTTVWSLVPYGKGWITDPKPMERQPPELDRFGKPRGQEDGKLFLENFHRFCLREPHALIAVPQGRAPIKRETLQEKLSRCRRIISTPTAVDDAVASKEVMIIQVADTCTADQFDAGQTKLLQDWVAGGGVLWANSSVLGLFGIRYAATPHYVFGGSFACTPASGRHPVTEGVKKIYVISEERKSCMLQLRGVIPLLASLDKVGDRLTVGSSVWTLVPYGKGWISDLKPLDYKKGDGAFFWARFCQFCLHELPWPSATSPPVPIPDSLTGTWRASGALIFGSKATERPWRSR